MKDTGFTQVNAKHIYVFVRTDLSIEQQAVQACHASIEAARNSLISPCDEHPSLVLCGVKSEHQLKNVIGHLTELNIHHHSFIEPDIGNELTAICTEPVTQNMRHNFRKYRCLRKGGA